MLQIYPNLCVQCGFCCLVETCAVGQFWHGIEAKDLCPSLYFDGDYSAQCTLVFVPAVGPEKLGIGVGCCIKARAYKNGLCYDFAMLPERNKKELAKRLRRQKALWQMENLLGEK